MEWATTQWLSSLTFILSLKTNRHTDRLDLYLENIVLPNTPLSLVNTTYFQIKAKKNYLYVSQPPPESPSTPPASKIIIAFPVFTLKYRLYIANCQVRLAVICRHFVGRLAERIAHTKSRKIIRKLLGYIVLYHFKKNKN